MSKRRRVPSSVFNGANSYVTIPDWTPTGKFGVFVQFAGAVPAAADVHILADASNRYIGMRGAISKAQFGAAYPTGTIAGTPTNGYFGVVVEAGKMHSFDGVAWQTTSDAAIVTSYTYTTIGKRGATYSLMAIQWILLYDYQTPENSRFYRAQSDGTLADEIYGATQPTCYSLTRGNADKGIVTPAKAMYEVASVANWEAKYALYYATNHPNYVASPTINTDFGEGFAWSAQYWVQTYIVMHAVTGNDLYLTRAKTLIDYMFSMTDSARFGRGEIYCANRTGVGGIDDRYNDGPYQYRWTSNGGVALEGVPAKGWRRKNGSLWQTGPLIDGAITSGIAKYCHYVLSRPGLASRHADALSYLGLCADIVRDHDTIWSDTKNAGFQSYYYINGASNNWGDAGKYGNPVAFNHTFVCITTMAVCNRWLTPSADFADKIAKTLAFWRLYRWAETRGGYHWWYAYDLVAGNRKSQDINHAGNLEMSCFYWLWKLGHMSTDEVKKCTKGLIEYVEFAGSGAMRYRVDGSYKFAGDQIAIPADAICVAQNAMPLAVVDQSIISLSRRVSAVMLGPLPSWNQWGLFNIAAHDLAVKANALDIAA